MKNILLLIIAFALVACSADQPAPTPTETFTPVPPTKTPVPPSATPEIVVDVERHGEAYSDILITNIAAGKYDEQLQGIKDWWSYRRENQLVTKANIHVVFLEDQNNDPDSVLAAIETEDAYLFPSLKLIEDGIARTIYDRTAWVNDPFTVYKTITYVQAIKQGFSDEMAKWLDGTNFAIRGRQMVRLRGNEVVAFMGKKGQWVKEFDWQICTNSSCVTSFEVTEKQLNDYEYLDFVRRNDTSGPFDLSKVQFVALHEWDGSAFGNCVSAYTAMSTDEFNKFYSDVSVRPSRRVAFANWIFDKTNGYNRIIKIVKFVNPDGSLVWIQQKMSPKDPTDTVDDYPMVEFTDSRFLGQNDPKIAQGLREWIKTGYMPKSLDGVVWFYR